jgi:hypothetical protein
VKLVPPTKTIDDVVAKVRTVLYLELQGYERQVAEQSKAADELEIVRKLIPKQLRDDEPDMSVSEHVEYAFRTLGTYAKLDVDGALYEARVEREMQIDLAWVEFVLSWRATFGDKTPQQVLVGENATADDAVREIVELRDLARLYTRGPRLRG